MKKFQVFLITVLVLQWSSGKVQIRMITDIAQSFKQPITITAFLCNKFDAANLIKISSSQGFSTSAPLVGNLQRPFPENFALFVMDLQCPGNFAALKTADKMSLFSAPYRWLLINNQNDSDLMATYFAGANVLVDSNVMVANLVTENFYNLVKIFKRGPETELVLETAGFWDDKIGFTPKEATKITARRRKDLMGTVLKTCMVITHNDSLNHLTDKRDTHIDTIAKVNYVLVDHLSNIVNATLKYSIQSTWGYKGKDSQWSGMIGELQRHDADIGGTALFLTADRIPVIDYVAMTTPTRSKFVFREPKLSYVANVYALPFEWDVWLSSLALIIIIVIVLYVAVRWEHHKKMFSTVVNEPNGEEMEDSWLNVTMLTIGATCQQGASTVPLGIPGRIITILTFISLMFLYTSYSANIVALLQSSSNSIRTLSDLLHSRLDVGVDDTVFNRFYFPNATEPVRRAIYLQKVTPPKQDPKFYPIAEGVRRLRNGYFAFHMETGPGYKIVGETFEEYEKCGLQEIQFLQVSDPWLAVQKNSSYREMLKIGLHQIRESGLQSREVSLLYTKKPTCTNSGSSFVSVGIIDCYLATAVLFCGMVLSLAIFALETIIARRLNKTKKQPNCCQAIFLE